MKSMDFFKLKLIIFDFDGVFTDNRVIVSDAGAESVICSRADGIGISKLKALKLDMMILSTERNHVVTHRAKKLGLVCFNGIDDKLKKLHELSSSQNVSFEDIAFVGNDINDLDCLRVVGFPVVVADAYPEVKAVARLVLKNNGGEGAVREFCDLVHQAKVSKA